MSNAKKGRKVEKRKQNASLVPVKEVAGGTIYLERTFQKTPIYRAVYKNTAGNVLVKLMTPNPNRAKLIHYIDNAIEKGYLDCIFERGEKANAESQEV